jgi:chemoreceptor zinc-binding protein
MSTSEEIDKAVDAHAAWKQKLRHAIDSGECESTPEKVKMDNNCAFGKWLHERIAPDAKSSEYYAKAVSLHADFHKSAGHILELALNGNKASARGLMGLDSDFTKCSGQLTRTLKEWQATL